MRKVYLILIGLITFLSCQTEEDIEIINLNTTLTSNSELSINLKRLTQNPTTLDNFIDNSSKIKIEFPFDVIVNNEINLSLDAETGYNNLIEILDATLVRDTITLNYPLNVSLTDHTSQILNSDQELEVLLQNAQDSSEINCVELIYPIDIQFFDASNTFIDSQTVINEAQFFNFLDSLEAENLFYQLDYPILAFVDAGPNNSFETVINSNSEFISLYSELPETCQEPLLFANNQVNTVPANFQLFTSFITQGNFFVSEFNVGGLPFNAYDNIPFNFLESLIFSDNEVIGEWDTTFENGIINFELFSENSFYSALVRNWEVISFSEFTLNLIEVDENGIISELTLVKN